MKTKTLVKIHEHMESGRIYFPDHVFCCDLRLTKGEIRDIIAMEYGIRPRKRRILKKRLKILVNDLLDFIIKEEDDQIKPLGVK